MREFDGVIDALGAPERQHATHLLGPANLRTGSGSMSRSWAARVMGSVPSVRVSL
jgi:hypothetical protein